MKALLYCLLLACCFDLYRTTMKRHISVNLFFFQSLLLILNYELSLCIEEQNLKCIESERRALLEFKLGLRDPQNLLSSWKGGDCCSWDGVACDRETGHVISVDLRFQHLVDPGLGLNQRLGGEISSSLLMLKQLSYLDLSSNDFGGSSIPDFIGSIEKLSYLNISNAGFSGRIPPQLGNLSSLRYLDLNSYYSSHGLHADSLAWLSSLSSLQYLDMGSVYLANAKDWFHTINMLPLSVLGLSNCKLEDIPTSIATSNLTSLSTLDLSNNQIYSDFPYWIFNLSNLQHLNLRLNHLQGSLPDAFVNMTSIEVIQLDNNELVGSIPRTISKLCKLKTLELSFNNMSGDTRALAEISSSCAGDSLEVLNLRNNMLTGNLSYGLQGFTKLTVLDLGKNLLDGSIPSSIGKVSTLRVLFLNRNMFNGTLPEEINQLFELVSLDVSYNSLKGVVSETHFANLSKLEQLSLASNSFVIKMSSNWVPSFRLQLVGLSRCKLGPKFPQWLQSQKDYSLMDLSNSEIEDIVPDWFWNLSQQMYMLDLSYNQISGEVPATLKFVSVSVLDLSFNKFYGPLPPLSFGMEYVDFSGNSFSGTLLPAFSEPLPKFSYLMYANNSITGEIPASLCQYVELFAVDLSSNLLSGELPSCWDDILSLSVLNLANNNLSGEIPSTLGVLSWLQTLHLNNNSFEGTIPMSLRSLDRLEILDFGENRLSGVIPTWIGESFLSLRILRLRSNLFHGYIPPQLSLLTKLQILDLADNNLWGTIPCSLGHIRAMALTHKPNERMLELMKVVVETSLNHYGPSGYTETLHVAIKGKQQEYSKNLQYVASIDLSRNNFSGFIPRELANLYGLENLNLSGNHLYGEIPDNIGQLKLLESLDFSRNKLSGSIPESISLLTSLSQLNLSYNNFSGIIPSGYQLQTLDQSSYIGNPALCGPPLDIKCEGDEKNNSSKSSSDDEEEYENEMFGLYIGAILGFVAGFWALWGTLLLSETTWYAYFKFIDKVVDRVRDAFAEKMDEYL